MHPARRDEPTDRPWFTLISLCLMSGCYLSHGVDMPDVGPAPDVGTPREVGPRDAGVDGPPACVSDADCGDGDRCTTDRCVGGRCTHDPIPFSRHTAYGTATGGPTDVTSDGARALVLTDTLGVEPFDAAGPAGTPTILAPPGGDRDWDSAIATNGDDAMVVSLTGTSIVLQSLTGGIRDLRPTAGHFAHAAWTGTSFFSIEQDTVETCTLREFDPVRGFVGDPVPATCPYMYGSPPWYRPVRGANGEVRLLAFGRDGQLVEWTPSRGTRTLPVATEPGYVLHSFVAREVEGALGAMWVRIEDDRTTTLVAAVLEAEGDRLAPVVPPIERTTTDVGPPYSYLMSAAACSHRFVLSAADSTGIYVLEMDMRGAPVLEWRSIGPFPRIGGISSACIDGGVVIVERGAVHVLTCEP